MKQLYNKEEMRGFAEFFGEKHDSCDSTIRLFVFACFMPKNSAIAEHFSAPTSLSRNIRDRAVSHIALVMLALIQQTMFMRAEITSASSVYRRGSKQ